MLGCFVESNEWQEGGSALQQAAPAVQTRSRSLGTLEVIQIAADPVYPVKLLDQGRRKPSVHQVC
jgi:hypothetical protein